MPIFTIPKDIYPLVPNAPGVPTLLRSAATILDTITLGYLGLGDALTSLIGAEPIKWSVIDASGQKFAPYDTIFAVGYQNDARVSDYPVELGAFAAYNKVEAPFDISVTLMCGGSEEDRAAFVAAVERARASLDLYTITTPEYTYRNVNFVSLSMQRTARDGAYLIIAQMTAREVRQKASAAYSTPKNIGAFDVQAQGQVQIISDPSFDATGVV